MSTEDKQPGVMSQREKSVATFSDTLKKYYAEIPSDVLDMNEIELEKFIKPTSRDFFLRKKFWQLAELNLKSGREDVGIAEIFDGIMPRQNFFSTVLQVPHKLAWMLQPITAHQDMIEEGLYLSLKKVRDEILTMTVTEKSAPVILKALEFFANRALGPMLQKIEQRSMNVNVDGNQAMREAFNPEDMQAKFAELQAKLVSLPSTAVTVDEPE